MNFTVRDIATTPKLTTQGLSYFLVQLLRDQKTPFVVQPQHDGTWRVHMGQSNDERVMAILKAAPSGMIVEDQKSFPEFEEDDEREATEAYEAAQRQHFPPEE